jgi:hypothetical protein
MPCKARALAVAITLAVLAVNRPGRCAAQAVLGLPRPVEAPATVLPTPPPPAPAMPGHAANLPPAQLAPAPCCNPYEDHNGPTLRGDPLLDDKCDSPPGWFGAVELGIVGAHVRNRLVSDVAIAGGTDTVHLPTADLDWTVSPRFEVGYRLPQAAGEFLLAYRFLVTSGSQDIPGFDAAGNAGALHSRLDLHAWDFDYANWENSLLPWCEMRWRVGARLAAVYFDSTAASPLLEQHTGNDFVGAGPHAGLDVRHDLGETGLAVFGRVEGAFLVGRSSQSFEEVLLPGPGAVGGATRALQTNAAPWLNLQVGAEWVPAGNERLRLSAGYTFERWWNFADVAGSRGDLTVQGVFLRGEIRY